MGIYPALPPSFPLFSSSSTFSSQGQSVSMHELAWEHHHTVQRSYCTMLRLIFSYSRLDEISHRNLHTQWGPKSEITLKNLGFNKPLNDF